MERIILHVDCNKFYASVECKYRPSIKDKPVVVGGSEELRHGIVLTKNEIAAAYGIKTAEPLWKAREKCPGLIVVPPNYPLYQAFSQKANQIYNSYTSQVESFGLDESWLDVTGSVQLFGTGEEIAHAIRRRVKEELGITVSVGVSFNKIFAKLGSDYKKPDAVTVFSRENYRDKVWPLPAEDMLMIGPATKQKLNFYGLRTIGDVARADLDFLHRILGNQGEALHCCANGNDTARVKEYGLTVPPKSIGNSTTTPMDMCTNQEVKQVFIALAENVAHRMRGQNVKGNTVTVSVRTTDLQSFTRQGRTEECTNISKEIVQKAMEIFIQHYHWSKPLRSVGIVVSEFEPDTAAMQMDLTGRQAKRVKQERLEQTVDNLRARFGTDCITTASLLENQMLRSFQPHESSDAFFHTYFR